MVTPKMKESVRVACCLPYSGRAGESAKGAGE